MLADRLMAKTDYDTNRELHTLELLKLRFGETSLHDCEIMLKVRHCTESEHHSVVITFYPPSARFTRDWSITRFNSITRSSTQHSTGWHDAALTQQPLSLPMRRDSWDRTGCRLQLGSHCGFADHKAPLRRI